MIRNRVAMLPGIDLRGDGGLVVAPPSLHPGGRRYVWEISHHPDETPLAPLPHWLAGIRRDDTVLHGHGARYWRRLAHEGVAAGERNNTIASFAGHLLRRGVDAEVAIELLLCWNRRSLSAAAAGRRGCPHGRKHPTNAVAPQSRRKMIPRAKLRLLSAPAAIHRKGGKVR